MAIETVFDVQVGASLFYKEKGIVRKARLQDGETLCAPLTDRFKPQCC